MMMMMTTTLIVISIWARALMVLMYLDLINEPFVPHNLISVQGSLVPC